jgi:hypothetical protein
MCLFKSIVLQQSRINHPSHRQSNHVTIQPCRADAILNASGTRPVFSLGFIQKPDCGIYLFSVPCRGLDGLSDSSPRISRSRRINCISAPPIRGYTNFKEDSAVCVAGCFGAESNVSGSGLGPEYCKCSWVRGPRGAEYGVWRAPSPDIDQIDSSFKFSLHFPQHMSKMCHYIKLERFNKTGIDEVPGHFQIIL